MRKLILFLSLITTLGLCFTSCNKSKNSSLNNKEDVDTVWNEKVQDTFYGIKLGDSLKYIVEALNNAGFDFQRNVSTSELLHFRSSQSQFFTFGGMNWSMLDIYASNDIFRGIRFMESYNQKHSAVEGFNSLKSRLESKYKFTEIAAKDSSIYDIEYIFGKNNVFSDINCNRYESIDHNMWYGLILEYVYTKKTSSSLDEL